MNIRLRQVDNHAASTVRYADIRYATNGVEVIGVPFHSPLLGESAEPPTDVATAGNPHQLGNLLFSDRNVLSVGGTLSSPTDIDWYEFELGYDLVQSIGGVNNGGKTFSTVFDIDYADGIVRPDAILSVYDEQGRLILVGRDSNVQDDQPAPGQGLDTDDLTRGSFGKLDPFIGSQQMPAGVPGSTFRYLVAVSSNRQVPSQLDAMLRVNGTNVFARLEPINSVQRVAEDHIGFTGYNSNGATINAINPTTGTTQQPLLPINDAITLRTHVVPFTLSDVALYVATNNRLWTVNPFTGQTITDVGAITGQGQGYGDLAMTPDGRLLGQTLGPQNGNSGRLDVLNTGSGGVLQTIGDDGLGTNPDGGGEWDALATRRINNASTFEFFAANNETRDNDNDGANGQGFPRALYRINTGSGAAIDEDGAAGMQAFAGLPAANVTGLTFNAAGNVLYAVTDAGEFYSMSPVVRNGGWNQISASVVGVGLTGITLGPQNLDVLNNLDANNDGFPDETADGAPAVANVFFATGANGRLYAFDSSGTPRIVFDSNADGTADASNIASVGGTRGLAFSPLDFNLWHPTTRRAGDQGHGILPALDNSRTPGDVDHNYPNGRTFNEASGAASYYFGLEEYNDNTNQDYFKYGSSGQYGVLSSVTHESLASSSIIGNNYNLPGGAFGALVTNPFSLETYIDKDKPTLYFNYFLDTQGAESTGNGMRDSARVYISNNNGITWSLLATNNSALDAELSQYISEARDELGDARQDVQELFETSQWRQARIDLADFAGMNNLRLRFEFHTAGSFNEGLAGDAFGNFTSNQRGQDNDHEGFYVDDIIIGLAERGEMVTGAQPDGLTFFDKYSFGRTTPPPPPDAPTQSLQGPYQLEIRRGTEYGAPPIETESDIVIFQRFDSNDRLVKENPIDFLGDRNVVRDQGHIQIENNLISNVAQFGVVVNPGARDEGGTLPYPGAPRHTNVLNTQRLAPGVTIVNNVIAYTGQGGIQFSGDANVGNVTRAAVPFGRILNNTIYGGGVATGVGVSVTNNASPTILNNVLANLQTGINIVNAGVAPVVNFNLFQSAPTAANGRGPDDFDLAAGEPLFLDPGNRNFYLAPNVVAIDSSINSLEDRASIVGVKTPLGIAQSVIRAPDNDVYGQRRIDIVGIDPTGQGSQVFKDRGAVERADVDRPFAVIVTPEDNDVAGVDIDQGQTFVHLREGLIERFQILLGDGIGPDFPFRGTGLDPATVVRNAIRVRQDGRTLREGVDYNFGYNTSSGMIELTPLSGIWNPNSLFTIDLNNRDEFILNAPSGLGALDGDQFTIRDETSANVTFEYESGITLRFPRTLELLVSSLGGAPGGVTDGQTFVLDDGVNSVTFEFDSNNLPLAQPTHVRVSFSQLPFPSTADAIATSIVNAILASGLSFAPTALPGGVVHLGSTSQDTVDLTNAPSLAVTGVAEGVADGQFFTIRNGANTLTFEFTTDGLLTYPTNTPINILPQDTNLQIAAKTAAAINGQSGVLDLTALNLLDGRVHLGGRAPSGSDLGHIIDTAHTEMMQTGEPGVSGNLVMHLPGGQMMRMPSVGTAVGGVKDGDTLSINDGSTFVVFEFDSNGAQNLPQATVIPISPSPNPMSDDQLADAILAAIAAAPFTGLSPVKLTQGGRVFIDLQGPVNAVLDASLTPTIYQPYQPNLGLIGDGETFTITHGGVTRTFEFDNNNSPMTNVRVSFADVMTGAQILAAIRTAIIGAGLGLTPTISTDTHSLDLNATARHTLNTNGTRIDHEGVPGGAVPVVFVPDTSFTARDMARRIFEAIDTTPLLTGVTAELDEQRIIVEGVVGVVGLEAVAIPPIADLSGNPIRQNRPDGSTKFTIVMPGVDLDYGDAPDLSVSPHRFPTVLSDNGARHAIIGDDPLRLGARVDADANGQPTDASSGDDNDFTVNLVGSQLTFAPQAPYVIAIPAASPALDGQSFTIDIGSGPVKFEFNELPGALNDMNAKPILYNAGATANDMANAVVIAIMAAEVELGLTPVNLGGGQVWVGGETGDVVDLTGAPDITLPANLPLSLQTPGAGFSLQLAETLQIQVPVNGGAVIVDGSPPNSFTISNGVISKVFEFDRNVPQIPGSRVIPYTLTMSQDALAVAIVAALQMEPALGLSPSYLGDGVIHLGTLANHTVNLAGTPALSLVPGGQAGGIAEGDTFTIHNGVTPFVFEFDNTPGPGGVAGTNIEIDFNAGQTRDQIAQSIVAAINGAAGLGLVATHLGNGSIELDGSTAAYSLTVPPLVQLTFAGVAGGVSDGDTFTLQAAGQTFVFEYDRDGNVALGNRAVVFTAGDSAEALATALAAAFADLPQEFNVNPTASGNVVSVSRDDEDGVTHGLLNQFLDTQFTITASGEGYLNAWIDYNQDGDWEDPGEHIFVDVALEPGVNAGPSLVTRTAAGALPGLTHARFRFSSVRGLSPTGLAEDGEVEDYVVNILPQRPPVAFVDNTYVTTEDALLNVPVGSGVLVNDTDADPDPKPSLVVFEVNGQQTWVGQEITLASGAKLTLNADGSFAYDPTTAAIFQTLAAGENSQDSFTYRASDQTAFGGLFSNEATVLIRIDGLNDAPTAFDDTFTGADEDTVFNIPALGVLANDTDIDASDVLSVEPVILTSSLGAQVTLNADGSISYDPRASATLQALAAGAQANDTFSYTLRDRVVGGLTDTGMVTVVVSGRNDAPIGVNDTGAPHVTDEDTTLVVSPDGVLGNDTDVDIPDTKTVVAVNGLPGNVGGTITLASGALLTMSANGGYVYNPNGRFDALQVGSSATDAFTYTVRDSQGATSIATVTVTINGVNDAPVAVGDTGLTNEDTVLNVPATGVLTNDTDKDAADTRVVSHVNGQAANVGAEITLPSGARLTMNADGSYSYDPRGSFDSLQVGTSDTDSFTYTVRDSQGATASGTVTITINGVNDAPTGVNDTGMTDENTVLNVAAAGVLANDIDVDAGDVLAVSAVNGVAANVGIPITLASGALLTLRANGSYTYSPNGKFESLQVGSTATDSFVYTVLDSQGASSTATVTITINGRNDAPVGVNDSSVTDEDTVLTVDAAGILANDTDVDTGDTKVVAAVNGSAANVGTQVTLASGALLTVNADGGYVFDPNGRYESLQTGTTATANFTYSVRDSQGAVATATVTITIQGRNDAPVGVNDSGATNEDTVLNVGPAGVLANDTDVDAGDTRTVSAVEGVAGNVGTQFTLASGALLTLRANGSYTYDPNDAFESLGLGAVGTDTFTYTLRDSRGGTSTATVTITIDGVNDAPVGVDDTVTANEDTVLTVSAAGVLANDTDVDAGDTKTVATINGAAANVGAQIALASGALLTVQADGGFLYDANGQFQSLQVGDTATDSFTYTVVDGQGASSAATVTIVVEGRNDAPVGLNDTGTTDEDTLLTVAASGVLANDTDVDDADTRIVSAVNGSSGGVGSQVTLPSGARLTMNADGGYVYDPNGAFESLAQGATGSDTFTYTVQDSQGASSTATVTITINGRNDAPVGVNDTGTTDEDTVLNVAAPGVLGNDLDVDIGDTRTVSAVNGAAARVGTQITLASGALLTVNANGGYSYNPARRFESLRPGQTASDSFNYTVRDSQGGVSTATVTITIEGRNEAPVATNDVEQTFRNFDATFNLTENDTDIDGTIDHATITIVAVPVNGTLTVNANGTVLYRPKAEFAGTDVFTYQVRDNEGALSNVATVSVTILNPPNAWQNPIVNQDVNDDDLVTVLDALLVANNIRDNQALTGQIVHDLRNPDHMQVAPFRAPFVDPSGDALVTVGDLLSIVTVLRDQIQSEGPAPEGEASLASSSEFVPFDPIVGRHTIVVTTEESNEIVDLPPQVVERAFIDSTHGAVVASDDEDELEGDGQDASMDLEDVLSAIADDVSSQWSDF